MSLISLSRLLLFQESEPAAASPDLTNTTNGLGCRLLLSSRNTIRSRLSHLISFYPPASSLSLSPKTHPPPPPPPSLLPATSLPPAMRGTSRLKVNKAFSPDKLSLLSDIRQLGVCSTWINLLLIPEHTLR